MKTTMNNKHNSYSRNNFSQATKAPLRINKKVFINQQQEEKLVKIKEQNTKKHLVTSTTSNILNYFEGFL